MPEETPNGKVSSFLRTQTGIVAAVVLLGLGVSSGVWVYKADNRVGVVEERVLYVICTSVPPQTRNELRALRVDCKQVNEDLQQVVKDREISPTTAEEIIKRIDRLEKEIQTSKGEE